VIESRFPVDRLGLPVCERGAAFPHTIRRHPPCGAAMCQGRAGARAGQRHNGVFWEAGGRPCPSSTTDLDARLSKSWRCAEFSAARSEASEKGGIRERGNEARDRERFVRSRLIVAIESRVPIGEPVSSEGDCRGRQLPLHGETCMGVTSHAKRFTAYGMPPPTIPSHSQAPSMVTLLSSLL